MEAIWIALSVLVGTCLGFGAALIVAAVVVVRAAGSSTLGASPGIDGSVLRFDDSAGQNSGPSSPSTLATSAQAQRSAPTPPDGAPRPETRQKARCALCETVRALVFRNGSKPALK